MKKLNPNGMDYWSIPNFKLKINFLFLFLIMALLQAQASTYGQNTKISLDMKAVTLAKVIDEIESTTEFRFLYNPKKLDITERATIKVKNRSINDILHLLFDKTDFKYEVVDKQIVVSYAETSISEKYPELIINEKPPQFQVSGTVNDEFGMPLLGATIIVAGTSTGTTTDFDGNYTISAPNDGQLIFSYVGFKTQTVPIDGRSKIDIVLVGDAMSLEETIVVGYGTQKKATLTGSVSNIDGEDLMVSQANNVTTSLAGRLPGLTVNQRSGAPGDENLDIIIRGAATFDNDPNDGINTNAPLIVVDGVPREGVLERLNPADIESISVLKDGSAAIYGARAANGVILVTTKTGSQGRPTFSLSYNVGITRPTKIPDMMDAVLFAQVYNEGEFYRQGRPATGFAPFYTDAAIQAYRDGSDPVLFPNTDWADVTLRDNPLQQRMNFQASGGSEKIKYLLSYAWSEQEGNYRNKPDSYIQNNLRTRIDVELTDNLSVTANIGATIQDINQSNGTDFVSILQANPTVPAIYPNGLLAGGRFNNSSLLSNRKGYTKTSNTPINSTFSATYKVPFLEGLQLDASFNYDLRNQFRKAFSKPQFFHQYNVNTQEYDLINFNAPISVDDRYYKWTTKLSNFRITYKKLIADNHLISAMVGAEQQRFDYSEARAFRQNFVSAAVPQINAGSADPANQSNYGTANASAYNNFLGRFTYDFKSKYLFEFVFRYDGSQNFPDGKRYGFFPGVSGAWRLTEESFMDNVSWLNELKLRATYGEIGNDRIKPFQFLQAFEFGNNYVLGGGDVPGIFSSTLPNPNVTWEVSKKTDFGFYAELWDGLVSIDFITFYEKRSNILLPRNLSVPGIFGFPSLPDENIGVVENKGYELTLAHSNSIGDFNYSISANVAHAKSNIIFMDEIPPAEPYQNQTGTPLGSDLYYKSDGIFNTQAELDGYPHGTGAQVGDIKVLDLNNDGVINGDDRYRANNSPIPQYMFGLTTVLRYKGFDMSIFIQGQAEGYTYDTALTEFGLQDLDNGTVYRANNRWTVNNQEGATMPRSNDWTPGATDFFLFDSTFFRLKNLEIGYTLPSSALEKTGFFKDIRLYLNGTNLFTVAKEITWRDPEISGGFTTYPPLRILSFGTNIKF